MVGGNHIRLDDLKNLLGKGKVLTTLEERIVYSYDASCGRALPDVVVLPENTGDVQAILRFASEHKSCVYPRGAGTGMTGGSLPLGGGIAVVFAKMNRILEIDTANLTARLEPGVILGEFKDAVREKGLFYPPDPASARIATIGGTVAENAGGLNSIKYGVTRNYVLALEVVSARGDVMRFGRGTMKSVSGYDITRLLVGSEGTLALITEITLKLIPHPRRVGTLLAAFPDDVSALKVALGIIKEPLLPAALEFMDEAAVYCARQYTQNPFLEKAGGLLLIEFDGDSDSPSSGMRRDLARARELCTNGGAIELRETSNARVRDVLWEIRRCISPAIYQIAPTKMNEDICVPRSEMPRVLQGIKRIAREHGIKVVNFAHAGDGNIHVNFMYNGEDAGETKRTREAVDDLFRLTIASGGTLSGEHGIGISKVRFLPLEYGPAELDIMRDVKKLFDPEGILNPAKSITEK